MTERLVVYADVGLLGSQVFRDGKVQTLEAAELVPGDLIIIRLGDIVPADCKASARPRAIWTCIDPSWRVGEPRTCRWSWCRLQILGEEGEEDETPMQIDQVGCAPWVQEAGNVHATVQCPCRQHWAPRACSAATLLAPIATQAALTGESIPAKKFTGDTAFSGSAIKMGERHAVVYATGEGGCLRSCLVAR